MALFFSALLGAVIGSFENVLIIRWHEAASIAGRSRCMHCGHTLRPRHLVPIVSWIWLRGRCADCGKKIHFQYPLVEAAAMVFGIIAAFRHPPLTDSLFFVFEFVVTVGLIVPVVMDMRWKELPIEYVSALGIGAFLFHVIFAPLSGTTFASAAQNIFFASAGVASFFGLQVLLSRRRWLGEGDVWFGAMMGAILGTPALTAVGLYLAYLFGGAMALIGLLAGVVKRGSRIPFAPALAAGTIVALWHGDTLLGWIARGMF